jgi:hypothetical protein
MYALLLIFIFTSAAAAHIGDRIYPIPEILDEDLDRFDLHDRNLEEWQSILVEPALLAADFIVDLNVGEGAPYEPADLDYQFWLGWNGSTDRLYVAMERVDDIFINEYAGGNIGDLWRHDGAFEFMVDGDHSGGAIVGLGVDLTEEERLLKFNRTAQHYVASAHAPDGRYLGNPGYSDKVPEWLNKLPYTNAGGGTFGETPTVSIFEGFVTPFDDFIWNNPQGSKVSDLVPDRIIGLAISIPDFDTEPAAYRAFHSLDGASDTWRYADYFSDGLLVGVQGETGVEDLSWARIKASFQGK